jgi:hypothetical protein
MEFTPAFFDESSAAWKMNKKRVGQMYVYVCSCDGDDIECFIHPVQPPSEKKLTHRYNLRSRSHHNATVQRVYNTRTSVHT